MTDTRDYDYELPRERIAQYPLARRSDARLMVVNRRQRTLDHAHVRDLPSLLQPLDAVVVNDTRVIPARLVGTRTRTGGRWQGLFLSADANGLWRVLGRTRGKLRAGETIMLQDRQTQDAMQLTLLAPLGGGEWAVRPDDPAPALAVLERVGRVPLPGYIRHGQMEDSDQHNYQTVFAAAPGAVAAPTAGLHFTPEMLHALELAGVAVCRVTLHVGIGTFRPIVTETLDEHVMHSEWGCILPETIARLEERRSRGGRIVAVGTTVVRTLESATAEGDWRPWQGLTQLFIKPPYTFRAVDALLTNFHLPRSTLLVLVRTFGGDALIRRAYAEAIREEYRFYSYGDAMLFV
jgi:S-adenosylmethionine:tRNA ribosyltransferase-isomerase